MGRVLRSVMLCNPRYLSAYVLGVAQASGILGFVHRQVSLFDPILSIQQQIDEIRPHVIWTHMALWPPPGAARALDVVELLAAYKRRGVCVFHHDGDPRNRTIDAQYFEGVSIALVNRDIGDGRYHGVPWVRWPYGAMVQKTIAPPTSEWACDLLFAGILRDENVEDLYSERTKLVRELEVILGERMRVVSSAKNNLNNRMLVADVAPSAGAVLGLGRPGVRGWVDTRVVQYPGAGGVLIHDDADEILVESEHYVKFDRAQGTDGVLSALEKALKNGARIRQSAFSHVQTHHTWINRVQRALAAAGV